MRRGVGALERMVLIIDKIKIKNMTGRFERSAMREPGNLGIE
jgi:hypothetical protein